MPIHDDPQRGLAAYLELLAAGEAAAWLKIRELHKPHHIRRRFVPAHRAAGAAEGMRRAALTADVFVGAASRARPRGDRSGIDGAALLWADCDDIARRKAP